MGVMVIEDFKNSNAELQLAVGKSGTPGLSLILYTIGTFLVVIAVYLATRGWKNYTAPEEVDLGVLPVSQTH